MKKITGIIMALSVGVAAQAQLIDSFSGSSLGSYTQTIVLAQSADPALTYSDSTGGLTVSRAVGTAPQQDLLLRNDYSLSIGQILRVDAAAPQSTTLYSDLGIAVSALVNPPAAVYAGANVDVRQDYVNVYLKRSTGAVGYVGFNGTANVGASSGIFPPSFAGVTGLFISRTAADSFNVGYTTASGDTALHSFTGMNNSIGLALGFYSDVRAVTSYGVLDNLRLESIPEPSSAALLGLMGLLSVFRMRRNK